LPPHISWHLPDFAKLGRRQRNPQNITGVLQAVDFGGRNKLRGSYPRTLIFEKDNTARPEVGTPIDIVGRNVVNTSIRITSGRISFDRGIRFDQ